MFVNDINISIAHKITAEKAWDAKMILLYGKHLPDDWAVYAYFEASKYLLKRFYVNPDTGSPMMLAMAYRDKLQGQVNNIYNKV